MSAKLVDLEPLVGTMEQPWKKPVALVEVDRIRGHIFATAEGDPPETMLIMTALVNAS
jgi:hypothetical protein